MSRSAAGWPAVGRPAALTSYSAFFTGSATIAGALAGPLLVPLIGVQPGAGLQYWYR